MSYRSIIRDIADKSGLSEIEREQLLDFADNFVGKTGAPEFYEPNDEYLQKHKVELQPIFRKLKESDQFSIFEKTLFPNCKKGVINV